MVGAFGVEHRRAVGREWREEYEADLSAAFCEVMRRSLRVARTVRRAAAKLFPSRGVKLPCLLRFNVSGIRSKQERKMATQNPNRLRTNCPGGSLTLGGDTTVNRLGFGAMRLCGPGVWGEPLDRPVAAASRAWLQQRFPAHCSLACRAMCREELPLQATRAVPGTLSGIRTGSLGAGSVGVGVGLGTTTGLGIVSGISMGSEPG